MNSQPRVRYSSFSVPPPVFRFAERLHHALSRWRNHVFPPEVVMLDHIDSFVLLRCIWIAAELGVADHLTHGAMQVSDLARVVNANPDALQRVMRALASAGIFKETSDGSFALSRLADCLRTDAPMSMRACARYLGAEWHWNAWGSVMSTIRNGRTIHENVHNRRFFEYYEAKGYTPEFDAAMSGVSALAIPAIVAGYNFAKVRALVDIAGGEGVLLAAILRANPAMRGTLYERPEVIARARQAPFLVAPEVAARVTFASGSMFEAIPEGFDGYLMKWLLHDWSDEDAALVLRNVRRAAKPGAKLLVVEMVVKSSNKNAKLLDVAMLALTGGRERTESEYRSLFATAGFDLRRVYATASPYSVLEAVACTEPATR